jgi:hypothetical protein
MAAGSNLDMFGHLPLMIKEMDVKNLAINCQ